MLSVLGENTLDTFGKMMFTFWDLGSIHLVSQLEARVSQIGKLDSEPQEKEKKGEGLV
jgi:hypothetical protein